MRRSRLFLVLTSISALTACAGGDPNTSLTPNDIEFVSVHVVDEKDHPEIAKAGFLAHLLPKEAWDQLGLTELRSTRKSRSFLRIEFSTLMNLAEFAQQNGYYVATEVYFCDKPDEQVLLGYKGVFRQRAEVSMFAPPAGLLEEQALGYPITYHFFTHVEDEGSISSHPTKPDVFHPYDLRNNAQDICFEIVGGSETGYFKSNTAILPKAAVQKAIRSAIHEPGNQ